MNASQPFDLSVITVAWNSVRHLPEQIRSVQAGCRKILFEQIVVDNGSSDQTVALVKQFPGVQCLENSHNAGFSAANNQGARIARGDFLLFLNPDMRVEPGSLDSLIGWMRAHPRVGIAGCKLVDERGNFNQRAAPRRFPTWKDQLAILFKLPHLFPGVLDRYLYQGVNWDSEQAVDSVRGSFMCVRRELINALGFAFDPRYYFWFEDVDLCREARQRGFLVMYTPVISCVDSVGASFRKRNFFWKQWQFARSLITYFLKWRHYA